MVGRSAGRTERMASGGRRVPVYGFTSGPAGLRVLVHRIGGDHARVPPGEHAHDFFLVTYVSHGSGRVAGPGDLSSSRRATSWVRRRGAAVRTTCTGWPGGR